MIDPAQSFKQLRWHDSRRMTLMSKAFKDGSLGRRIALLMIELRELLVIPRRHALTCCM